MKKSNKTNKHKVNIYLFLILIILLLFSLLIFKKSNFNKPIPDIVEIPDSIKESIKNTKPQKYFKMPILMYHYVEYVKDEGDTIRKSLNIIPFIFDAQVKTLKDAGFSFVTQQELADALDNKFVLPERSIMLTFDDGYRDFYTDVFPILKKYNAKAVVYVVPNFLNKPNNLDIWQIKEMLKSGLVEVGAHTMDHSYLVGLPLKNIKYEVEESKKYLEENLGIKVVSFAYPYGVFDDTTMNVVKDAGFTSAVTTVSGKYVMDINRFFLYRTRPGARTGTDLLRELNLDFGEKVTSKH